MTFVRWPTGITAGGAPPARHLRSNPKTVPSDSHAGRHHGNNDHQARDPGDDPPLRPHDGDAVHAEVPPETHPAPHGRHPGEGCLILAF